MTRGGKKRYRWGARVGRAGLRPPCHLSRGWPADPDPHRRAVVSGGLHHVAPGGDDRPAAASVVQPSELATVAVGRAGRHHQRARMDMHSGSMRRIDLEIRGPVQRPTGSARADSAWTCAPTLLHIVRAHWPLESAAAWVEAAWQRRAARRAAEAEERRLEWWRSH